MRAGRLIFDGLYLLICVGLVAYMNSRKREALSSAAAGIAQVLWAFIALFALGRLVYDLIG
jgi:hypothetical protein